MTVAVTGLCVAAGWTSTSLAVGVIAVFTGQLSVGWSNDAHDAHIDRAQGRRSKPVVQGIVSPETLWRAAVGAVVVCVPTSLLAAGWGGTFQLLGVAAAWGYNVRWSRTTWSWLPYLVAFAAIPAYVTLGSPAATWPAGWLVVVLASVGVAAHLANALRDRDIDARTSSGGVVTSLGPTPARWLAVVLLGLASLILMSVTWPQWWAVTVAGGAAAVVVALALVVGDGVFFRALMIGCLVDLVVIMAADVPLTA